jgi:flagellar basal-body rod protein FlgC
VANVDSRDPKTGLPYRRQGTIFTVGSSLGPDTGVSVKRLYEDQSQFPERYEPGHPYADKETGMLKLSNVDPIVEMMDMIEATRAYEANVTAMDAAKSIIITSFRIIA